MIYISSFVGICALVESSFLCVTGTNMYLDPLAFEGDRVGRLGRLSANIKIDSSNKVDGREVRFSVGLSDGDSEGN